MQLEDSLEDLSVELTALKHIIDGLGRKGDREIYPWLQHIESIARNLDEMQNEFDNLERDFPSTDSNKMVELNMRVIKNLETVKALTEKALEAFLDYITLDQLKRFSYHDLFNFTSQSCHEIGSGGFGKVYKGQLSDGELVAIKVLTEQDILHKDAVQDIFVIEVSTMLKASHPNLIKLYGFCFDDNMKALVYEYMENGSLDKVLFKNHLRVEWNTLYCIAIEIAKALAHLHHGCDDQIIHHDVKPSNVLLDLKFSAKVTDFGTARIISKGKSDFTMTRFRGTNGYVAPEMATRLSRVSYTCDVYSYGMLLFDVLAMRRKTRSVTGLPKQVWDKFNNGELNETIKDCGITENDREKAKILSMVALWCVQFTPERRPSMTLVADTLEKELEVTPPPDPSLWCNLDISMQQLDDPVISPSTDGSQSESKGNLNTDTVDPIAYEEFMAMLSAEEKAILAQNS